MRFNASKITVFPAPSCRYVSDMSALRVDFSAPGSAQENVRRVLAWHRVTRTRIRIPTLQSQRFNVDNHRFNVVVLQQVRLQRSREAAFAHARLAANHDQSHRVRWLSQFKQLCNSAP